MFIRLVTLLVLFVAGVAIASDHSHSVSGHHKHSTMNHTSTNTSPKEAGQGAFAALAEIVSLLESDPNTDWSRVDIDGLREHLVDMNTLTLNAEVTKQVEATKVIFTVTGDGQTLRAIQAMVPAHSAQLARTTSWRTDTTLIDSGVVFTISSEQPAELQKIAALGFFGVMAVGSHHQQHHLQMANGKRGWSSLKS